MQYAIKVTWDDSLTFVEYIANVAPSSALNGLAVRAVKITTGAPTATAGKFIPGALIPNAIDGVLYENTGTTAAPVWSVVESSGGVPLSTIAYNSDATAGPLVIAAAKMVNAILDRDGGATNRSDTTATAAAMLALLPGAIVGTEFYFYYRNISTTAGQIDTLTAGSGVTLSGNATILPGQRQVYIGRFTNVTVAAVTLYAVNNLASVISENLAASTVNTLRVTSGATTAPVSLAPVGSDTNVGMKLDGKGSGAVNVGQTSTGIVAIARGALKSLINGKALGSLGTAQNTTPTAAQVLGGILTQTGATGAGTATLPTGATLSAAIDGVAVGDSFEVLYAVLGGGQTITITAGATGMTILGTAAIPSGKVGRLTFVCTATDTWSVFVSVSA